MYAIIETGGKQYRVLEGDTVFVEKLEVTEGDEIVFDKVIAVGGDDGLKAGAPYLDGAKVTASVVKNGKSKKVMIFKYKSKKNERKRQGHRQPYTKVEIKKIEA
jgi:large subunit ribosomal protein L21